MPTPNGWKEWHHGAHYEGDACLEDDPYHHDHKILYPRNTAKATEHVEDSDSYDAAASMISEGGNAWT